MDDSQFYKAAFFFFLKTASYIFSPVQLNIWLQTPGKNQSTGAKAELLSFKYLT